jgi:hypothetical protein
MNLKKALKTWMGIKVYQTGSSRLIKNHFIKISYL